MRPDTPHFLHSSIFFLHSSRPPCIIRNRVSNASKPKCASEGNKIFPARCDRVDKVLTATGVAPTGRWSCSRRPLGLQPQAAGAAAAGGRWGCGHKPLGLQPQAAGAAGTCRRGCSRKTLGQQPHAAVAKAAGRLGRSIFRGTSLIYCPTTASSPSFASAPLAGSPADACSGLFRWSTPAAGAAAADRWGCSRMPLGLRPQAAVAAAAGRSGCSHRPLPVATGLTRSLPHVGAGLTRF